MSREICLILFFLLSYLLGFHARNTTYDRYVKLFYYKGNADWMQESPTREVKCGNVKCEIVVRGTVDDMRNEYNSTCAYSSGMPLLTVGIYLMLYLNKERRPYSCDWPTHFEVYESLESVARFSEQFQLADQHFKYNTTTSIYSTIPRYYPPAFLHKPLMATLPFSQLIKGANYVASDCEEHSWAKVPSRRETRIKEMRAAGFRVDGLGICLHTPNITEGIVLKPPGAAANDTRLSKPVALSRYLFHLAFENTIEEGYVSEKPFDALLAGTVPIYLGDAVHMKKLAPHPKALIYVADFDYNMTRLVSYLTYLAGNETAYEEHRAWRKTYAMKAYLDSHPMYQTSWQCDVCRWAVQKVDEVPVSRRSKHHHSWTKKMAALQAKTVRRTRSKCMPVENSYNNSSSNSNKKRYNTLANCHA